MAAARLMNEAPDVRTVAAEVPEGIALLVRDILVRRREDRPDAPTVVDRVDALRGNANPHRRGRGVRLATLSSDTVTNLVQPRVVAVHPFVADEGSKAMASVLESAVADALVEARVAQVVRDRAPGVDGAPASVAPTSTVADLVVQGSLHASKERIRARLRVLDRRRTAPLWSAHVDGTFDDTLDFEDRVVEAVREAIRFRTSRDPGPRDPSLREAYERARAAYDRFSYPDVRDAIAILEEIEAKKPGDPRVRALLAEALLRSYPQSGANDASIPIRAEELALRALEEDDSIADAHYAIAMVRFNTGELSAALRTAEECLRHAPLHADAHFLIGKLLTESLVVDEGRRRVELAARLEPRNGVIALERIRVAALLDEERQARALLRDTRERAGPLSVIVVELRLAFWWRDREMARAASTAIGRARTGASWDAATRLMDSFLEGRVFEEVGPTFATLTGPGVGPRHRCMMHEIAAEYLAVMGEREMALGHVVEMQRLPQTDLLWLDRCPALDGLRDDPRFAETRAAVAARVADLWG